VVLDAEQSAEVLRLEEVGGWDAHALRFVRMTLRDAAGGSVADNFYWLAPDNDFTGLNDLPPVALEGTVSGVRDGGAYRVTVTLTNPGEHLAFFVHPRLTTGRAGDEILPTFWSDNYFSLLPGETRSVAATVDTFRVEDPPLRVRLEAQHRGCPGPRAHRRTRVPR
jgi:exo-1,4-beta-D-glucosaminidase